MLVLERKNGIATVALRPGWEKIIGQITPKQAPALSVTKVLLVPTHRSYWRRKVIGFASVVPNTLQHGPIARAGPKGKYSSMPLLQTCFLITEQIVQAFA